MYSINPIPYKPLVDNQSIITEFMTLERAIIEGTHPNSPELISRYIALGKDHAKSQPESTVSIYIEIFSTLSKAAESTHIERQWRQCCLDACYRPLYFLKNFSLSEDERNHIRFLKIKLASLKEF